MLTASLLMGYKELQDSMALLKEREMEVRRTIAGILLEGKEPGTHTSQVGDIIVKATRALNHSLDVEKMLELQSKMSPAEQNCIVLKPQLSLTEYKKLPYDERKVIDECIVVKDAAPTIKIIIGDNNDD